MFMGEMKAKKKVKFNTSLRGVETFGGWVDRIR